ncbi:MAG: ABC transporter permease [Bryobacteraceae bacterium]|nr:ABC transporter permease [Bryobacteraceae bacterium]
MAPSATARWEGEYLFALRSLLLKDFRLRYRNMSLGIGWSLANPLVMMAVLTFIFTKVFPHPPEGNYPIFVLCGIIPFNFFTLAWATSTTSLIDNAALIKRTRFPREIVPITTVLGNVLHYLIQLGLLLALVLAFGRGFNVYWLYLPVIIFLEILFVIGLSLAFSAIDVYVRDTRYVVESFNVVFFWLVPIFYSFTIIPPQYHIYYRFNPIAAVVLAFRNVLIDGQAPGGSILMNLALVSGLSLVFGVMVFERLKRRFYDYL